MSSRRLRLNGFLGNDSRHGKNSRALASRAPAIVEHLEARQLLALVVGPISTIQGALFNRQVATFAANDVSNTTILDYKATIQWGDGTSTGGSVVPDRAGFKINGSHTYASDGTFNLAVTLVGKNGDSLLTTGTSTVAAAPVIVTSADLTAMANIPFNGSVATFTVPGANTADEFSASVNWGDGTTTAGVIAANGTGFSVNGTHTYTTPNQSFKVTTNVVRISNGQLASDDGLAVVKENSLTLASASALTTVAGQSFTATLATLTDGNPLTLPGDYTATISWGDGTTSTATISSKPGVAGAFDVVGSHTYARSGSDLIGLTVIRKSDNKVVQASTTSTVAAANSVILPNGTTIAVAAGQPFSGLVATFATTDSSSGATYSARINWGDGTLDEDEWFSIPTAHSP